MGIPQRVNFVTLGAHSVAGLRHFYEAWGWTANSGSSDDYVSFVAGTVRLAIYPVALLRDEAAPGQEIRPVATWSGVTLAVNFATRGEVDRAVADAVAAGATAVSDAVERDWGGYSAYVSDPEGNRWELAWAPGFDPT